MNKLDQYIDGIATAIDKGDRQTIHAIMDVLRHHRLTYAEIYYMVKHKRPSLDLATWDALLDD